MRVHKPRRPIQVQCIDCPTIFTAYSSKALRCEECRAAHLRRNKAAAQARYRSTNYVSAKAKKTTPHLTIGEVLKAMERYNKEHNTHYTYGQFVALMEGGKIIVE